MESRRQSEPNQANDGQNQAMDESSSTPKPAEMASEPNVANNSRKRPSDASSSSGLEEDGHNNRPMKKVRKMRKSMDRDGQAANSSDEEPNEASSSASDLAGSDPKVPGHAKNKKNMRRNIRDVMSESQMDDQTKNAQVGTRILLNITFLWIKIIRFLV